MVLVPGFVWRSSLRLPMKTFGVVMIDAYHRACWKPTWGVFATAARGFRERYSYSCFFFAPVYGVRTYRSVGLSSTVRLSTFAQ